jgi:phage shock protein PspC (stress-responsive transcriptional regulator)
VGRHAFQRGSDRILGGVCSGLAEGFHVGSLWVRLAFVLLAFFQGIGLFLYLVLWLVMPEQPDGGAPLRSGFDSMADDLKRVAGELRAQFGGRAGTAAETEAQPMGRGRQTVVLGVILVAVGALLLGVNTRLVTWSEVWPAAVIALGAVLLIRAAGRAR